MTAAKESTSVMLTPVVAIILALTAHSAASVAESGLDSAAADVLALNTCIEIAIGEDAAWPNSPIEILNHLFSLTPDCLLPASGAIEPAGSSTDSLVALVFRHSLPSRPQEGQWLEARLSRESDGTWRMQQLVPFSAAPDRDEWRRDLRVHGVQWSDFDMDQGPIGLLQFLKQRSGSWGAPVFPRGWIQESDLAELMALVDSTEPCASVISIVSSVYATTTSTVGNEAAYLIEGFRIGEYPPRLVSTSPRCDVREIKEWWGKRVKP